jgi:Tol biopolymer transport system component
MSKLRLLGALVIALAATSTAQATAPGKSGSILFFRTVGKYDQAFTARPDGTHVRQLTHLADSGTANGSWSADGKRIAFARDFDCCGAQEHLDIYTMNADGSGLHGLGLKGLNGEPIWFPDGHRILFGHPGGLWVIPATGGTPHLMLRVAGDFEGLALSPNGRDVALVRNSGNRSALFVAALKTRHLRQVTPWKVGAKPKVDWSPDGSLLLSRNDEGVFTVRPDGSELTMLVRGTDYCSESFSPDGRKVLFIAHCSKGSTKGQLFTANLDGTGVKRIPNVFGHWVSWGIAPD